MMTSSAGPPSRVTALYQAGALALALLVLGATAVLTADGIRSQQARAAEEPLRDLLNSARVSFDRLHPVSGTLPESSLLEIGDDEPAFVAFSDEEATAAILPVVTNAGYGGRIRLRVALARDGSVLAYSVQSHRETTGLGDAIDPERSAWATQFAGLSLENVPASRWQPVAGGGEFEALTGATISSRAVIDALQRALSYYAKHGQRLFMRDGPMEKVSDA